MKTQGKVTIVHVGAGRTNPNNKKPQTLILELFKEFLITGHTFGPETSLDKKLHDGELKWEDNWRKEMKNV